MLLVDVFDEVLQETNMEIQQKKWGSTTVLELQGEIVATTESSLLIDVLHDLLAAGQKQVVIDLTRVNWLNSSGLGTLISGLQTMRQNGGDLKLCGISEKIRNLFSITKLLSVFVIYESAQEAVSAFAAKN